jgi:hypothetical protein
MMMATSISVDLGGWGYLATVLRADGNGALADRIAEELTSERQGRRSLLRYVGEDARGRVVHELTADGARLLLPGLVAAVRAAVPGLDGLPAADDEAAEQARADREAVAMRLLGWIAELHRQEDELSRTARRLAANRGR